jgi:DNA-binding NarL/FixJ family response regulator
MSNGGTGSEFLARKSELMRLRQKLPHLGEILIIDDNTFDADSLMATLNMMFSYGPHMRRAKTLGSALDSIIATKPDLVFLDDILPPTDTALTTIPFLRRCKYEGPIVVVSGEMTRQRRLELKRLGAGEVIHKDDLNSARLTEAIGAAFGITDSKETRA